MTNNILKISLVIFSFSYLNLRGQEPLTEFKSIPDFKELKYRNVGPTRGGRVTSVCGVNNNQFTGVLPEEICNQGDITPNLSSNKFCPPYPSCMSQSDIDSQDTSDCP